METDPPRRRLEPKMWVSMEACKLAELAESEPEKGRS